MYKIVVCKIICIYTIYLIKFRYFYLESLNSIVLQTIYYIVTAYLYMEHIKNVTSFETKSCLPRACEYCTTYNYTRDVRLW